MVESEDFTMAFNKRERAWGPPAHITRLLGLQIT